MKSWKTTLAGIISFFTFSGNQLLLLLDGDPATQPEWSLLIAGITTLFGLFFARDNDVSSEAAGAK